MKAKFLSDYMRGDLIFGYAGGAGVGMSLFLAYNNIPLGVAAFVMVSYGVTMLRSLYRIEVNQLEILNHHRLMVEMGHLHAVLEGMKAEMEAAKHAQRRDE